MLHGADALPHVAQHPCAARQHQIRVRLMLVATHATTQLIEITKAKPIRAINNDGVRVRNIEAAFDDRRGEQHVCIAVDERSHHFFQIVGVHLAMPDHDARIRHEHLQLLLHRVDRRHAIVQEEHLTAARHLAFDRIANGALVVFDHDGLDGQTIIRRRLDRTHVPRPGKREIQRARNRRGTERQHIHERAQSFELLFMQHTEALFFINHHQAEVFERDIFLHDAMCADDYVHRAFGKRFHHAILLTARPIARHQFDSDRIIRHALAKIVVVLLREDSGRHEDGNLFPTHHGLERRADGDFRFPETHVAADQTIHRLGAFHVGFGFDDGAHLIRRFFINERALELALPDHVRRKRMTLLRFAHGLDAQHLRRDITHRMFRVFLRFRPTRAAELI